MERRIQEAAETGNIELMQDVIKSDILSLKRVAITSTGDTALHTACLAGNLHFVSEFLKHGKEFVYELNQDCLSPLHIAAAGGHIEIVRELLKVDGGLCLLRGRDKRIPLHCAVVKGRVSVVRELLLASVESIEFVTSRGETVLHLAVKSHQFEVMQVLVEHVEKFIVADVINWKDERGDTILHLAAAKRQHEVVDFWLRGSVATSRGIEVNSTNEMGYTPLDMLRMAPSEAGDVEIQDIFTKAGGLRATEISKQQQQMHSDHQTCISNEHSVSAPTVSKRSYSSMFKFDTTRDKPDKVRDILLLIAILITTSTFQAGLSPSDIRHNKTDELDDRVGLQRLTIFEGFRAYALMVFLLFNTLGFLFSLHMINILIRGFPLQRELRTCMVGLGMSYAVSLISRLPEKPFYMVFLIAMALPLPILAAVKVYKLVTRARGEPANAEQGQMNQA